MPANNLIVGRLNTKYGSNMTINQRQTDGTDMGLPEHWYNITGLPSG